MSADKSGKLTFSIKRYCFLLNLQGNLSSEFSVT
jgi:hypothetical protein